MFGSDVHKLPFRGTICNGQAKFEQSKMGHAAPVWFVFSGAKSCSPPPPGHLYLNQSTSMECWTFANDSPLIVFGGARI